MYPSEKRKGMGEKNFFFPYRNESRTLHSQLAVSLSPVMVGERVHAFSKLKNTAPTFSLGAMKGMRSYLPKNQPELKLISLEDVAVEMGPY